MTRKKKLTESEFLMYKLSRLYINIPDIKIRYEFRNTLSVHIIEISPKEVSESISYLNEEILIESEYEKLFPKSTNELLFINEDSLMNIRNSDYALGHKY